MNGAGRGYRCILAPVDGGAFGEHALPLAAAVASRAGAVLCLAHVHVPPIAPAGLESVAAAGPWNEILREQAGRYLEELGHRLRAAFSVRTEAEVLDGPVLEALTECAEARSADLLVMSTHGHAGIRRVWHHCVAEQLIEGLAIPALLVRPADEEAEPDLSRATPLREILLALEPDSDAALALEPVAELARLLGARITLLEVVPSGTEESGAASARQRLEGAAARLRNAGLEVGWLIREATEPGAGIVALTATSSEHPVDLIAMERHPHRGLGQLLATHTTDQVIAQASVPVLLYPRVAAHGRASDAETRLPSSRPPGEDGSAGG